MCTWGRPRVTPGLPAAEPWAQRGFFWAPSSLGGPWEPGSAHRGDFGSRVPSLQAEGTQVVKQAAWGASLAPFRGGVIVVSLALVSSYLSLTPPRKNGLSHHPILQTTTLRREVSRSLGQSAGFDSKQVRGTPELTVHGQ